MASNGEGIEKGVTVDARDSGILKVQWWMMSNGTEPSIHDPEFQHLETGNGNRLIRAHFPHAVLRADQDMVQVFPAGEIVEDAAMHTSTDEAVAAAKHARIDFVLADVVSVKSSTGEKWPSA